MVKEMSIADYLDACRWYDGLPPHLQPLAERFLPGTKWVIPSNPFPGWLTPFELGEDGKLNMYIHDVETGMAVAVMGEVMPSQLVRLYEH